MQPGEETYIGDGVYLCWAPDGDPMQIRLRAPRGHGNDFVFLEPKMLAEVVRFLARPEVPSFWLRILNEGLARALSDTARTMQAIQDIQDAGPG